MSNIPASNYVNPVLNNFQPTATPDSTQSTISQHGASSPKLISNAIPFDSSSSAHLSSNTPYETSHIPREDPIPSFQDNPDFPRGIKIWDTFNDANHTLAIGGVGQVDFHADPTGPTILQEGPNNISVKNGPFLASFGGDYHVDRNGDSITISGTGNYQVSAGSWKYSDHGATRAFETNGTGPYEFTFTPAPSVAKDADQDADL